MQGYVLNIENSIFHVKEKKYYRDPLTGAYNRFFLGDLLKTFINKVSECNVNEIPECYFAICMLDLNGFKFINDTYGHLVGDSVLRVVGQSLKKSIRDTDVVIRYGGDEFLLILAKTKPDLLNSTAKRIYNKTEEEIAKEGNIPKGIKISIAMGFLSFELKDLVKEKSWEPFIYQADKLMYGVKNTKKEGVAVSQFGETEVDINTVCPDQILQENSICRRSQWNILNSLLDLEQIRDKYTKNDSLNSRNIFLKFAEWAISGKDRKERIKKQYPYLHKIFTNEVIKNNASDMIMFFGLCFFPRPDVVKRYGKEKSEIYYKLLLLILDKKACVDKHPEYFQKLIKGFSDCREHWDGSGFPIGKKGTEISELARLATCIYRLVLAGHYTKTSTDGIPECPYFRDVHNGICDPCLQKMVVDSVKIQGEEK